MMIKNLSCCIVFFMLFAAFVTPERKNETRFNDLFLNHYSTIIGSLRDNYGAESTSMWLANWNLNTNEYPFDFSHSDSIPNRVYLDRSVDAPGGSSLYWNLPDIAASVEISKLSNNTAFERAAQEFVKDYLDRCTSKNGIILWGNHYFYDVMKDKTVKFKSSETPKIVDFGTETGDLHEIRPLLPPWELLYSWFPERIEKHILESSKRHLVNIETGEFNRHANNESEYAFIEAGSILVNSLAFLYSKTKDSNVLKMAESIVEYSFTNRNYETGLMINSPSMKRWDQFTSTTEIGLWSLNILKATEYVPQEIRINWINIVELVLKPWLEYGFDTESSKYYGALNVNSAKPIEKKDNYPYKPETYADIWIPLFPTHNYPMHFAECCILLSKKTGKKIYKTGAERWVSSVKRQLEEGYSGALYAENYARIIHFLINYGREFNDSWANNKSKELAAEAISNLYIDQHNMFRGHTKEMRYDAVDGIGLLFFALRELENHNGNGKSYGSSFF
ncbi:MAG: hypothetical protein RIG77_24645 [Cyclobacteriaceae bacterium]